MREDVIGHKTPGARLEMIYRTRSLFPALIPLVLLVSAEPLVRPSEEIECDHGLPRSLFEATLKPGENAPEAIRGHLRRVLDCLAESPAHLSEDRKTRRTEALQTLDSYIQQGVFPKNTLIPGLRPIFIDGEGRACAVGHMMMETGYEHLARRIAECQNMAYIGEIEVEGVEEWVRDVGLTLEECAMIQPSYGAPGIGPPGCNSNCPGGGVGRFSGGGPLALFRLLHEPGPYKFGEAREIRWVEHYLPALGQPLGFDLFFSVNGEGGPFFPIVTDLPSGAGFYSVPWTVPPVNTAELYFKLVMNNTIQDVRVVTDHPIRIQSPLESIAEVLPELVPPDPHVSLIAPSQDESLVGGSVYIVTWFSRELYPHEENLAYHLYYSLSGPGGPFWPIATDLPPGSGLQGYPWLVPQVSSLSEDAYVKVVMDNRVEDASSLRSITVEVGPLFSLRKGGSFEPTGVQDIDIRADVRVRNGAGTNPGCLQAAGPPVLGTIWEPIVSFVQHPSTTVTALVFSTTALPGTMSAVGEILVDFRSPLFVSVVDTGLFVHTHTLPIPDDPRLLGFTASAQGVLLGANVELCNALDIVLGY